MRLLLLCLLLTPMTLLHAQDDCGGITLPRARFAMAIADREPVGPAPTALPSDYSVLFFYTEVVGGDGRTLLHQWYYRDKLVAQIRLHIGGNHWRTWSRKNLGHMRDGDWRVEIRTADGCLLTQQTLSASASLPVLDQARALLDKGDVTGAQLLIKEQMGDNIAYRQRLSDFLDQDVAVARIRQQIDDHELYMADARLSQLEADKSVSHQTLAPLRQRLEQSRSDINRQTTLELAAFERVQQRTLAGGTCPGSDSALQEKLAIVPASDYLLVNSWARDDDHFRADLLDQRTGFLQPLSFDCPPAITSLAPAPPTGD